MQGVEMLIPILVPLGLFAMIFGIVYLQKKENLAMIEKGMNPRTYNPSTFTTLKWGLLMVGAGIGLFLAYILDQQMLRGHDNEVIYFALIAIGGGLGLIASYRVERKEVVARENRDR